MDVSSLLSLSRSLSGVDAYQVPDATALAYLNLVYDDLWTTIARDVGAERFTYTWYVNVLADVGTYALPVEDGTHPGLLSVERVSVSYVPGQDYRLLRRAEASQLAVDSDVAGATASLADPFYIVSDGYLALYPVPAGAVPSGLKIVGTRNNTDLALGGSEASVEIPKEFHHVLALGVRAYVLEARSDSLAGLARARYAEERTRAVESLSKRRVGSVTSSLPDLARLS